jgi:hypothetical protein
MEEKSYWKYVKSRPRLNDVPDRIKKEVQKQAKGISKKTVKTFSKQWIENLTENAKMCDFSKYSIYSLKDKYKGETAYLVGASPSLSKNVKELKKKKGIIIACGHVLKFLLENGVKPDFVIVLDANEVEGDFLDVGDKSKDIKLLADIMVHPKVFKIWKGRIWFFRLMGRWIGKRKNGKPYGDRTHQKLWTLSKFNDLLFTNGSVMGGAYSAAELFGIKRIVFVGMDFSMPMSSSYVLRYSGGEEDEGTLEHYDQQVDVDISGRGVWGKGRMFFYKYWFDGMSMIRPKIEFINATEGGILGAYPEGNLKSIKQMKLSEVN